MFLIYHGAVKFAVAIALVAGSGCGREGFVAGSACDGSPAAPSDGPAAAPALVGVGQASTGGGTSPTLVVPLAALGADAPAVIVVGATISGTGSIASVTDPGGDVFVSASARAPSANATTDLWLASVTALPASVTITLDASYGWDAWAVAFSHVAAPALDNAGGNCSLYPAIAVASATTTKPYEPVFGVTMLQVASVTTVASPFASLVPQRANGAAVAIAPTPGSYGPQWMATGGMSGDNVCSSTLSLRPR